MSDLFETTGEIFAPLTVEKRPAFNMKDLVCEFPDDHSDWPIAEAFLCLVLSAALADGRVAPQETEELQVLAHRSRLLKNLDPNELAAINRAVVKRRADRPDWMGEACRALPHDMHLTVFIHCLDICLADAAMVIAEAEFLEALLAHLRIEPGDVREATRILAAKNRY